jgi:RNA polymerase sigma factor (sigma-70 family)
MLLSPEEEAQKLEEVDSLITQIAHNIIGDHKQVYFDRGDYDDLLQEGRMGALIGLRRFDPSYGVALLTYITHYIRGGISHYMRKLPYNERTVTNMGIDKTWHNPGRIISFESLRCMFDNGNKIPRGGELNNVFLKPQLYIAALLCDIYGYSDSKSFGNSDIYVDAKRILNKKDIELIELKYLYELSTDNICKILGVSQMTIHRKLKRCYQKMKTIIERETKNAME